MRNAVCTFYSAQRGVLSSVRFPGILGSKTKFVFLPFLPLSFPPLLTCLFLLLIRLHPVAQAGLDLATWPHLASCLTPQCGAITVICYHEFSEYHFFIGFILIILNYV